MPIVNVNAFQQGINESEYLTSYTDQYLKQALANLGQRLSVKGDGIKSSFFTLKELFPNYLGSWDIDGLCANFRVSKSSEGPITVLANLVKWVPDNENKDKWHFEELDNGDSEAQTSFIIDNAENVVGNVASEEKYKSVITLDNGNQINDTDNWNSENTIIIKTDDSYIYKTRSNKDGLTKEIIFEEIYNDNVLKSGFRTLTYNDKVYLLYLTKAKTQDLSYVLTIYKMSGLTDQIFGQGSIPEKLDSLYNIIVGADPSDLNLNRYSTIEETLSELSLNNIDLLVEIGSRQVDYNNEKNQLFSFPESVSSRIVKDIDEETLQNALEYFSDDVSNLYPMMQRVFNDAKYGSDTNVLLYRQIISSLLIGKVYDSLRKQHAKYDEDDSQLMDFVVTAPVDFKITYNVNNNNPANIYNSINNIEVKYIDNFIGDFNKAGYYGTTIDIDIIDYISSISNVNVDDDGNFDNVNCLIVHGYETKAILYQFTITYIEDKIINKILWDETFALPYVNKEGNWNIDGIDTDIYAYGRDAKKTNFVVIQSELNDLSYAVGTYNSHAFVKGTLIADPYDINHIFPMDQSPANQTYWQTYPVKVPFLVGANTDQIDDTGFYNLQAYLPAQDYLNKISNTNEFSYIENTIFVNLLSPTTEQNTWYASDVRQDYVEGYHPVVDKNTGLTTYVHYSAYENTLISKIGTHGVVTTFWTLHYNEEGAYYYFDYLKRPGENNFALDMTYVTNLDAIVKYYMSETLEPDNYEHSWLVFDAVNRQYKNNSNIDEADTINGVIENKSAEYYLADFGNQQPNASIDGDPNKLKGIYSNDLNMAILFHDNVQKDEEGMICYVGQKAGKDRYFSLFTYDSSYSLSYGPDKFFVYNSATQNELFRTYGLQNISQNSYSLADAISHKNYSYEWIPNAATLDTGKREVIPMLDLSEVLIRDSNILNRTNILSVGRQIVQQSKEIWPLYYAYFGASYDDEDKSRIHIGTSKTNINLGQKTMISDETAESMTQVEELDIDIANINLNGRTEANDNVNFNKTVWRVSEVTYKDSQKVKVYSATLYPVGVLDEKSVNAADMTYQEIPIEGAQTFKKDSSDYNSPTYNLEKFGSYQRWKTHPASESLLSTIEYNLPNKHAGKKTRYLDVAALGSNKIKVSYLNLSKLFEDNDMFQNTYIYVSGDKQLTYHTYLENQTQVPGTKTTPSTLYKTSYYLELSTDLSDDENLLIPVANLVDDNKEQKRIVASNPIAVSYVEGDVAAFTYVDKIYTYYTYLYPSSYTEVWSCTGCDYCSQDNCQFIKMCSHARCTGWATYHYGRVREDKIDTVKCYTYELTRYAKTVSPNNIGGMTSTMEEVKTTIQYPNPKSEWKNSTEFNGTVWTYVDEYGFSRISSTDPGPRFAYVNVGKIVFELSYEKAIQQFQKYNALMSYSYRKEMDGTYTITYKPIDDKNAQTYFVSYTFRIYEKDTSNPLDYTLGNKKYTTFTYKASSSSINKKFTYSVKQISESVPTTIHSIFVNVRELKSTHSIPYSEHGVASLNQKNQENAILGTNKYA